MVKILKELSNVGLDHTLASDPGYGGSFSKDQLPSTLASKYYIVNMQDQDAGRGSVSPIFTHLVAHIAPHTHPV